MAASILKAVAFLAGFIGLLWLGVLHGEKHTPEILAAVIAYVAGWQFLFAREVAEGLTRHYGGTLLANFLPAEKLAVTPAFVRGLALVFAAAAVCLAFL